VSTKQSCLLHGEFVSDECPMCVGRFAGKDRDLAQAQVKRQAAYIAALEADNARLRGAIRDHDHDPKDATPEEAQRGCHLCIALAACAPKPPEDK
jgi:hypothetical protein